MTIGELAREAGLRPSAVRYYESLGLLPVPDRRSGRRVYTDAALATGFTLRETRQLVRGFSAGTKAGDRWRALAEVKLREMEKLIAQAEAMRGLLLKVSRCRCETLVECGGALARTRQNWGAPPKARPS